MPLTSTKRALIAVVVILCVLGATAGVYLYRHHQPLAAASAGQAPDLLSLLPSDAPVVAYVDVAGLRRLQNSRLAAGLGLNVPVIGEDRDYQAFVRATGFDYARDLDRAAIAFWPASLGTPANVLGEDRVLAIAEGRFDEQKIKAYALQTGRTAPHGAQTLYEVPGNPPVSFEFLSPTRIVVAGGKNVDVLLPRTTSLVSAGRDPAMQARIERVAGAPIFAVARTDNLPPSFYAGFGHSPQLEHMLRSVKGLTLAGKPDGDQLDIALDAECDSMKSAFELATLLDTFRMFGSVALSDPKTRRQMTKEEAAFLGALINQLKVDPQDRWVRLKLIITPEMLGTPHSASSNPGPPRHIAKATTPSQ
ncbi:MAG: hypothetical protein WBP79_12980 [Candidatus Acidiferrales bacterium]